ncbi:MAG: ABC transporter ATP-binding protein [Hespellia sp.]|nr:ABC transporter ATP-binding protein [Hespellia sp.]
MLKVKNLQKNYSAFHLNCSLEVREGMITGLIGANGAGKTTLFKSILGLISIEGGEVSVLGTDSAGLGRAEKEQLGVVLTESGFSGYLTVKKIVPILASLYSRFDRSEFLSQCRHFQLPMDKMIKDFSTGMRAKLNVLIAMSHDAKLLILDEPTSGLDVLAREELLDMMRNYMEEPGRAILISSHISSDLEGLCDNLYMIHEGKIVFHEDTDVLLDEYGVLKLTKEQYDGMDKEHLLYRREESFGVACLTDRKQFFLDNYPQLVVEKGKIDDLLLMVEKGVRV